MLHLELTPLPSGIASSTARLYRLAALLLVAQAGVITAQADNLATSISVDANANRRPINPNIYGQNWASPSEISALNAPVNRYGGNANSRYNWQIDAHSSGADWYFETYSDGDGTGTPGGSVDKSIVDTRSAGNGVEPMITIPMLDYLAKLGPNRSTLAGFSVKKYGAQQKTDPWNSDAGNGISLATGKNITGNDPLDTGVANSPDIQKAWVQHLVSKFGNASASTGIKYYILDNEPSAWVGTHRDVHPNRPGYDEMYDKVVSYASAIRSADPSAQIIGIEEWDWWSMYVSGIDQGGGNDYASHGNVRYYPWMLQQLAAYKQQTGVQLVDIISVHGYTDMDFSNTGGDDTLAAQQIRNRHTRILWDPNYKTPFWWKDVGINGGVINWIPTLRGWVDTYYPGLKIAFTEYSWGNETNLNGATTQADVLGIYGREGLDMANRWGTGKDSNGNVSVTFLASKIYRNYDGLNSTFGDTSVSATVASPDNLSAFAAVRGTDGALTVMVINKQQGSTPVTVNLAGFSAKATAQAWQINSKTQTSITQLADVAVSSSALTTTVPSQSITLFVIPTATTTPVNVAPAFTTQPANQTVTAGSSFTFSAAASGTPAPTYQWKKDGVAINGATSNTFTIVSVVLGDTGSYTVVATNAVNSVTSNPAILTVNGLVPTRSDFNGDGKSDVFLSNIVTGDRAIWFMDGAAISTNVFAGTVPVEWTISGTGDFNGDGKADLFWTNTATGDRAIWLLDGSAIIGGGYMGTVAVEWVVSGTGDFNGDGKNDIVWTNITTGERTMWLMNGTTISSGASLGVVPAAWTVSGTGDFDGDGKSDILLSNTTSGDRVIWFMNGSTIATNAFAGTVPVEWSVSAVGDFDGGGKADILWTNTLTGDRAVWLMNGNTNTAGGYLGAIPVEWVVSNTGDYNGDGKADILWSNTTTGERAIWLMNGTAASGGATLGVVPVQWIPNH